MPDFVFISPPETSVMYTGKQQRRSLVARLPLGDALPHVLLLRSPENYLLDFPSPRPHVGQPPAYARSEHSPAFQVQTVEEPSDPERWCPSVR
jgi:hypothetical protein